MLVESFFGNDLSSDQCDALAMSVVGAQFLSDESELFNSKWFDYRHLHPTIATYLYAHHYTLEYRKIYQKIFDKDKGMFVEAVRNPEVKRDEKELSKIKKERAGERAILKEMRGLATTPELKAELEQLKAELKEKADQENAKFEERRKNRKQIDIMTLKEASSFWIGRQAADRIGMPYNLYLGAVMRFLVEKSLWKRIPRPNQLYSDNAVSFAEQEWGRILSCNIVEPSTAHLIAADDFSLQCQQQIERWLCERISERKNPHFGLSHYLFERKVVTEETALQFFNSQTIEKARKLFSSR